MLMTIKQVAAFLQVSPKMVRRFVREGRLRLVPMGRLWRVDSADVDLLIERCKI